MRWMIPRVYGRAKKLDIFEMWYYNKLKSNNMDMQKLEFKQK